MVVYLFILEILNHNFALVQLNFFNPKQYDARNSATIAYSSA